MLCIVIIFITDIIHDTDNELVYRVVVIFVRIDAVTLSCYIYYLNLKHKNC